VRQLIEEAQDPKRPDTGGETWSELQRVAERLKQNLPNADITDEVTTAVEAESRPTDERASTLLEEATDVLDRLNHVQEELDELDSGSIVIIDKRG
jgi:HPt (histidine-containing phosphotransfer) domain-containing protein